MQITSSNKKTIFNIFLLVICAFIFIFFSLTDNSNGMGLNNSKIAEFNEGWTLLIDGNEETVINLPQNYKFEPGTNYSIEREINRKEFIYPVIRIRSSMMNVNAYIDNQLIYSFDVNDQTSVFHMPYTASWQLIDLPIYESIGKTLKITFSSPTTQFSGLLNSIVIGEGEAIVLDLINQNFLVILISIFTILFSLFALFSLFWTKKLGIAKHIIYLAFFGINAGFWILSESTFLQLILPNRFIVASTSYILNLILPFIIVSFFRDVVLEGFKKVLSIISSSLLILLMIEIILQLAGIVPFISTTLYSIILIFIAAMVLIFCLVDEGYKKKNIRAKHYLYIFLALFGFTSIIMGLFIYGTYNNLAKYLALGIFAFYLLVMMDALKSIQDLMEARNKSHIYRQLAYEDFLTKGWNRTSFEHDIKNLIEQGTVFRLVLLDLNHLKLINDTYGHKEGDYAISESYNSLKNTVKENGKSYRISGDEFAIIINDTRVELFEEYRQQINQTLKNSAVDKPYDLVLAFGTQIYKGRENFTDFYKKVDIEMYKHKRILKTEASK